MHRHPDALLYTIHGIIFNAFEVWMIAGWLFDRQRGQVCASQLQGDNVAPTIAQCTHNIFTLGAAAHVRRGRASKNTFVVIKTLNFFNLRI